ncbi:hypothetical protein H0R92_08705 [Treponema sp. OMZ 840]|uniref:thioredoxin family protein n=1 Tax=Treponema sp. OMZ 840 TaxID=244313 RepID=UPI003D909298
MNEKRTIAEIDADIAHIQKELAEVRGTETEVYSRIVGYYRSVRNWNKGKRDEYNHRKQFVYETVPSCAAGVFTAEQDTPFASETRTAAVHAQAVFSYEFFGKATCPNCPPVKKYLENLSLEGSYINVDTEAGLHKASQCAVLSAPTVILFNENREEIARAHSVAELEAILNPAAVHVA